MSGAAAVAGGYRSTADAWLTLLRLHHAPITMSSGLAGMAAAPDSPTALSVALGASVCFLGYPLGQVFNDYADREADAVNAPHRPFVSGAVNPRTAMSMVVVLSIFMTIASIAIAPAIALWALVAIAGNVAYSATKGIPMLGNVVNGIDLGLFVLIGAAATRPEQSWLDMPGEVFAVAALVSVAFSGFCLVSYFKDIEGDGAAGYRTIPVILGAHGARPWAFPLPVLAVGGAVVLALADPGALGADSANAAFWILLAAAAAAMAVSLRHVVVRPEANAYEALLWHVRGIVLYALALAALGEPWTMLALAVPLVIFLEVTYGWTRRTRQP
jgi:4-hydroxybenzoate polyprenyltransferase